MKCPECDKEMEKGFITSSGFAPGPIINKKLFWYKDKGLLSQKEKVNLGNNLETFICEKCKVILAQY